MLQIYIFYYTLYFLIFINYIKFFILFQLLITQEDCSNIY